jgi:hypothetical protein
MLLHSGLGAAVRHIRNQVHALRDSSAPLCPTEEQDKYVVRSARGLRSSGNARARRRPQDQSRIPSEGQWCGSFKDVCRPTGSMMRRLQRHIAADKRVEGSAPARVYR